MNNPLKYIDPSGNKGNEWWRWLNPFQPFIMTMQFINDNTTGLRAEMVNAGVPDFSVGASFNGAGNVYYNGSYNGNQVFNTQNIDRSNPEALALKLDRFEQETKQAFHAERASKQGGTPWMNTAINEYESGVLEKPKGSNSGPRVNVYLNYAGVSSPNAWCGAFVNWCLGQNGIKGAGAAGSNYSNWGTKLEAPKYGAIAVFKTNHVGFFMNKNADGTLKILHGNWSNQVKISSGKYDPIYPNQIKEYRYPLDY